MYCARDSDGADGSTRVCCNRGSSRFHPNDSADGQVKSVWTSGTPKGPILVQNLLLKGWSEAWKPPSTKDEFGQASLGFPGLAQICIVQVK